MTEYVIRTDLTRTSRLPAATRLLDWGPGDARATIQTGAEGAEFFAAWRPTPAALDLLVFGAGIYCADKLSRRREAADAWTRDLRMTAPVRHVQGWSSADWPGTLRFLTGDRWAASPMASAVDPLAGMRRVPAQTAPVADDIDAVCLFSGGLDSLTGAIDLLEDGKKICLVSHHEGGQASTAQQLLANALGRHYGPNRIELRRVFLRPAPANGSQERPLPRAAETTTRGRSMLFLTAALAVASAHGPTVPVVIPENGFIGVNVPLTRARAGTLSTRTTHPHFMSLFERASATVGVPNPILNPYRLMTKGEMLADSRNPSLLWKLSPSSVSCAHPETARYQQRPQGNCGYCFPCLIRRASLAHVGRDTETYAWDALGDPIMLNRRSRRGADLRAVVNGAFADRPDRDVLLSGPLPDGERDAFLGVWRRGTAELRSWLVGSASGSLGSLVRSL